MINAFPDLCPGYTVTGKGSDPRKYRVIGVGPDSLGRVWVSAVTVEEPKVFETRPIDHFVEPLSP